MIIDTTQRLSKGMRANANAMPAKDACSTSRILNVSSPKKMAAQSTGNCTEWIASAAPQKHNCIEGPKQDAPGAARTYPLNEAALECRQQGQTIGMKKKQIYIQRRQAIGMNFPNSSHLSAQRSCTQCWQQRQAIGMKNKKLYMKTMMATDLTDLESVLCLTYKACLPCSFLLSVLD